MERDEAHLSIFKYIPKIIESYKNEYTDQLTTEEKEENLDTSPSAPPLNHIYPSYKGCQEYLNGFSSQAKEASISNHELIIMEQSIWDGFSNLPMYQQQF